MKINSIFPAITQHYRRIAGQGTVLLMLTLMGCASVVPPVQFAGSEPSAEQPGQTSASDYALIAADLVHSLMQLPGYEPWVRTLQMTVPKTELGQALRDILRASGYGLQYVSDDQGLHFVSYARTEIRSEKGFLLEFSVGVQSVDIKRTYIKRGAHLYPISPIRISGATPANLVQSDGLYQRRGSDVVFPSGVIFEDPDGEDTEFNTQDVWITENSELTGNVNETIARARKKVVAAVRLNSAPDLRAYSPVRQAQMKFPSSDPSIMGSKNKSAVYTLSEGFEASRDIFTVADCDPVAVIGWGEENGSTRAQRVRAELHALGVHPTRVHQISCSFADTQESQSGFEVVLTLWRLKNFVSKRNES